MEVELGSFLNVTMETFPEIMLRKKIYKTYCHKKITLSKEKQPKRKNQKPTTKKRDLTWSCLISHT